MNRAGRQAGIDIAEGVSAEGATQAVVPRLQRSFVYDPLPGLTAGPIHWRPFGPIAACHNIMRNPISARISNRRILRNSTFLVRYSKFSDIDRQDS